MLALPVMMRWWPFQWLALCHSWQKGEVVLNKSSLVVRGRVSIGYMIFLLGEVCILFKGCSEDFCIFSFPYPLDTLSLVHWSCDHLVIANLLFIWFTYIWWGCYYIFHLYLCVVSFLSLRTYFLLIVCNLFYFRFTLRCRCKHKISQLQKIKQLKRNMVCKYKFVLMNNEYNLYFNSFTKEYPLILFSLNMTRTRNLLDFNWKMDWSVFTINL